MGLVARQIEARGIPTLSMSSALSITQAVNPPRAVYLDYPLGHTSGKPLDEDNQLAVMHATLQAFAQLDTPGQVQHLPFEWGADHSWKDRVMRPSKNETAETTGTDDRVARFDTPQYQHQRDADQADPHCPSCVFLSAD
ncbi:MAG: hypothetical protein AAF529_03310 [Pseudomonadota bacterium]